MLFYPTKTKFKKNQKLKSLYKLNNKSNKLMFGCFGLKSLEYKYITNVQLETGRKLLIKTLKKCGKVWIRCYPYQSLTKKPLSSRMGKGKGKHSSWVLKVTPGTIIYEIDGLTYINSFKLLKSLNYKLPFKTKFISKYEPEKK